MTGWLPLSGGPEEVAVDPERLGIRTLRASALELVEQGLTSYEEVLPLLNECL